jgi:hypothetical protein
LAGFNKSYFTKIDITETPSIQLFGKHAKLVASHPEGTFVIENKGNNEVLKIISAEEFWSVLKYLE